MKNFILKNKEILLGILLTLPTLLALIRKYGYLSALEFLGIKVFYLSLLSIALLIILLCAAKFISLKNSLILTFPSGLMLYFFGIERFNDIHYIFNILIGIWLISASFFVIKKINKKNNDISNFSVENKNSKSKSKKIFTKFTATFLLVIVSLHLAFTLYSANKAIYVDERLWTYGGEKRIQDFWTNIAERDWKNTRVSDKPGVTLTWISGVSLFWTKPAEFKNVIEFDENGKKDFLKMLFLVRLPLIIFTSLSLIIIYFFIAKLFDNKTGLISITFISLSSLLIGISRLINPDALTWIFIPLTVFSYFIYQKNNRKFYLYFTGILLGLSILTKYIANLLFPFFLLEIFTSAILLKEKNENYSQFLKRKLSDLAIITILSLITTYVLYPGIWVKLDRLLLSTIWSQPFESIWIPFTAFILFLVQTVLFDKKTKVKSKDFLKKISGFATAIFLFELFILYYNVYSESAQLLNFKQQIYIIALIILSVIDILLLKKKILFSILRKIKKLSFAIKITLPTILIISIFFVILNVYLGMKPFDFEYFISSPKTTGQNNFLAVYFSGFYGLIFGITPLVLIGILANLFFQLKDYWKKTKISFKNYINWQISLFIFIYFSASAFSEVVPMPRYQIVIYPLAILLGGFGLMQILKKIKINKKIFTTFLILFISVNVFALCEMTPFYFSYNSSLLPKNYIINPKDLGEGNYEIAEYLNNLPNAKNLKVWSDRNRVCDLFIGECTSDSEYDYYIVSANREGNAYSMIKKDVLQNPEKTLNDLYTCKNSKYKLILGNREKMHICVIPVNNQ